MEVQNFHVLKPKIFSPLNFVTELSKTDTIVLNKGLPRRAVVAQGVPGRFGPCIFLTFGTTRVVGHQPYAPATFTPGEILGTHFQRLVDLRAHSSVRESHRKIPSDTTGN
jgi:hypothetical protein